AARSSRQAGKQSRVMAVAETASRRLLRRSRPLGVVGVACSVVIVIAALAAVFGSALAPHDPDVSQLSYAYGGPSGDHLLGWDGQGRDLFSRLLVGARTSMIGPLVVVMLSMGVGTLLAVATAWRGGWFDTAVSGVLAPQADWGVMVSTGKTGVLQGYPAESLSAGLCIVVVVVAFNLLGERLAGRNQGAHR